MTLNENEYRSLLKSNLFFIDNSP